MIASLFFVNDMENFDYSGSMLHICLLPPYILPKASVFVHCQRQSRHLVYAVQLIFCSFLNRAKNQIPHTFLFDFCCLSEQMFRLHHISSYVSNFFFLKRGI